MLYLNLLNYNILLSLVVIAIGGSCVAYSFYYMNGDYNLIYYNGLMILFILSMLMLLASSIPIWLLLGWEFLGITSFFLIFYYQSWESFGNSLATLLTMRLGDYFFFLYLSSLVSFSITMSDPMFFVSSSVWVFMVVGFTKSAIFPFSGWLPKAMSAPTPTSALVHSSTLVVAGFVLFFTHSGVVYNVKVLVFIFYCGLLTLVLGSVLALLEYSAKKLVAYSTLSQMGMGMMAFGLGNFTVGYLHLISHGLAKSLLFIEVGYLIHSEINQQDVRKWSSSGQVVSFVQVQLLVTLFSLCGLMFLSGMVVKESLLSIALSYPMSVGLYFLVVGSIFITFLYCSYIWGSLFVFTNNSLFGINTSKVMMFVTFIPTLLVVSFMCWLSSSVVSVYCFSLHLEHLIPVCFIAVGFFLFDAALGAFNKTWGLTSVVYFLSNVYNHKWVRLLLPAKVMDMFFYFCIMVVSVMSTLLSMMTQSMMKSWGPSSVVFFVFVLFLI